MADKPGKKKRKKDIVMITINQDKNGSRQTLDSEVLKRQIKKNHRVRTRQMCLSHRLKL